MKWPNDVYVNDKKIAGVLIESNLRGSSLESAIIGIGLECESVGVWHTHGDIIGIGIWIKHYDREAILEDLLCSNLEKWYMQLKNRPMSQYWIEYHKLLMWRGELRNFKDLNVQNLKERLLE